MRTLTKKVVLFFIGLLALAFFAYLVNKYVFRSRATSDVAAVAMEPATKEVAKNTDFNLGIRLNTNDSTKKISAVDLLLQFDANNANLLDYVAQSTTFLSVPESYFTEVVTDEVRTAGNAKQVRVVLVAKKSAPQLVSNLLLNVKFKSKGTDGTTNVTLVKASSAIVGTTGADTQSDHQFQINDSAASSEVKIGTGGTTPTLTPNVTNTPAPTLPPNTPRVGLKVRLQGVTSLAKDTQIPVRIKVVTTAGQEIKVFNGVDLNAAGTNIFTGEAGLVGVAPGNNYRILIKGPKHLQKKFCHLAPDVNDGSTYNCSGTTAITLNAGANPSDYSNIPLLVGDLPPQDGVLNAKDAATMRKCLQQSSQECIDAADLNYDGVVNATDFSLLLQSMQLKYDEEQ